MKNKMKKLLYVILVTCVAMALFNADSSYAEAKGDGSVKNPYSAYKTRTTEIYGVKYYGKAKVKLVGYKDGDRALKYLKKNGLKKNPGKSKEYVYLKFKIKYFYGQEEIMADLILNPYTCFYTSNSKNQIEWIKIKCNDGIKDVSNASIKPGDTITCKAVFLVKSEEKPITYKIPVYDDEMNEKDVWFMVKKNK